MYISTRVVKVIFSGTILIDYSSGGLEFCMIECGAGLQPRIIIKKKLPKSCSQILTAMEPDRYMSALSLCQARSVGTPSSAKNMIHQRR